MSVVDSEIVAVNATTAVGHGALRRFAHKPLGIAALIIIAATVFSVAFANWIAPYGPLHEDLTKPLTGPSLKHLLGTDHLGRDVLSRLLFGGRPALAGIALAAGIFLIVGVTLGTLAGFLGGKVDRFINILTDLLFSVPAIIMVLSVLAIFNQNILAAMATLGVLASATLARIVRASCLSIREADFVAAARVSCVTEMNIIRKHVIPLLVGPVVVQISLFCGVALGVETGLGFLGLGDVPPNPSWGSMIGEAARVVEQSSTMLYITGGFIALVILAFGVLGDAVRDATAEQRKSYSLPRSNRKLAVRANTMTEDIANDVLLKVSQYNVGFVEAGLVRPVVKDLSFTLRQGEILGIVGESGSGKTVTILSLLGLLPESAIRAGEVWLLGEEISRIGESGLERLRGRKVGLVSQEPMMALDPMFNVGAQLVEILNVSHKSNKAELQNMAVSLLARVRLRDPGEVMKLYPHQLSGGMAQRVAIACAIAGNPSILIADEPTTALDVTVQAEILDLLRDLQSETGMGIILVTHNLGVVADACNRAIVMSQGEIVESATIEDLFYSPSHEYTRRLLESTPSMVGRTWP